MSEKKLYQKIKKNWDLYIERIEPKNEIGIPDVHMVNMSGADIFLELKFLPKKFKEAILPIKKTQFIWHSKYSGRYAYMLFEIEENFYLFRKTQVFNLRGKVKWTKFENLCEVKAKDIKTIISYLKTVYVKHVY